MTVYQVPHRIAPTEKGGEKKGHSAINEVLTREYTFNIHKRLHGVGFEKQAPRALKEIRKFAMKEMGTPDNKLARNKEAFGKYGWSADVEDTTRSGATDSKDDDNIDLFGSDEEEESEEAKKLELLAQYESKKPKKSVVVAKSSILLDVKPWDNETDMAKLEECVRSIQTDGLVWGSSKLGLVGYDIKKLQIQCVAEDDKVGTDMLEERITAFEDYVQSMDVAAFNNI
ncbi:elongation factor 1-beta-like [Trichosurus vulpecula]|uniref:elongation factor 1-beta-like n=1 Tax=Trichosurus vulpecula TaxID=9337 RepID=UPI00186AC59A|nr:elongation factor 1-beta-like [Trichosurus vulpecula]